LAGSGTLNKRRLGRAAGAAGVDEQAERKRLVAGRRRAGRLIAVELVLGLQQNGGLVR
jgi:hypothetical protein